MHQPPVCYCLASPHPCLPKSSLLPLGALTVQVAWVGLQLTVLYAQRRFGPRFFIPARVLPEKYNYFRPVRVTAPGRVEDDPTGRAHRARASPAVAT